MNDRLHPAFRLRELGPEFRPDYGRTLADQLHRRYDHIADERMPQELVELAEKIKGEPGIWR